MLAFKFGHCSSSVDCGHFETGGGGAGVCNVISVCTQSQSGAVFTSRCRWASCDAGDIWWLSGKLTLPTIDHRVVPAGDNHRVPVRPSVRLTHRSRRASPVSPRRQITFYGRNTLVGPVQSCCFPCRHISGRRHRADWRTISQTTMLYRWHAAVDRSTDLS